MIKDKLAVLVNTIKNSDDPGKDDDLNIVDDSMQAFGNYVNNVYMQNCRQTIIYARYEGEELREMIQALDASRRNAHEGAIVACAQLNRLCTEFYDCPVFCPDTQDRYVVADFCAQVAVEFYLDGIGKDKDNIDTVVSAMKENDEQVRTKSVVKEIEEDEFER